MATLPTNIPANGILTPDPALDPVLTPISDHAEQLSLAEAGVSALETTRNDRWYPKFHIASNGGWINDPNGLCFYKGRWHVFYQLHPHGTQWGPMHWGHVSSDNMVDWHREPIAFAPSLEQERHGVFSGSAVIGDDGKPWIFYTGHRWANGKDNTGGDWQDARQAERRRTEDLHEGGHDHRLPHRRGGPPLPRPEGVEDR